MKFQIFISLIISILPKKISKDGINLIKKYVKFYPKAYLVPFGDWKIGYGTTNSDFSITKTKITKDLVINEKTANDWLVKTINKVYAPKIMKINGKYFWNQNQFDALCSYLYDSNSLEILTNNAKKTKQQIANFLLLQSQRKIQNHEDSVKVKRRKDEYLLFTKKGV